MNSQAAWLALLAVFSGISMNLILQCGLGMRGIAITKSGGRDQGPAFHGPLLVKLGLMFATVLLLWLIFSFILSSISLGFFEYILLFPAS